MLSRGRWGIVCNTRSASSLDRTTGRERQHEPKTQTIAPITSTRLQCFSETLVHRPLSSAIEVIPEDDDT